MADQKKTTKKVLKVKPEIKQTLTSLYRMAKTNPMLVENNAIETSGYKSRTLNLPTAVTSLSKRVTLQTKSKPIEITPVVPVVIRKLKPPESSNHVRNTKPIPSSGYNPNVKNTLYQPQNPINSVNKLNNHVPRVKTLKPSKPRRSLSAQHFERTKHVPIPLVEKEIIKAEITQSLENIPEMINKEKKIVTFHSPFVSRPSLTPQKFNKEVLPRPQSTPMRKNVDVQTRLNEWLKKRGKSLSTFHHLKCFGVAHSVIIEDDENKENVETPVELIRSESYEALKIDTPDKSKLNDGFVPDDKLKSVVKEALHDLHKLISQGYPLDQCEAWLGLIRQKNREIEEEPQYWECRALAEQSRGNISSALECYSNAILKGANVVQVEDSLDQLFQKFSLLNINTSADNKEACGTRETARVCNIFKSTIIQFAVRQRNDKKIHKPHDTPKRYLATPVRRSTRLSRSSYINTPGVTICNSLQDLNPTVQEELLFQSNSYIN